MFNNNHFLFRKRQVKPLILLIQLLYLHLFKTIEDSSIYLFCGIVFSLILKVNYYWFAGVMISPSLGKWQPINLLFGLLTCNQLSTTLLFFYTMFNSLLLNSTQIYLVFNILSLLALAFFVWNTLPYQLPGNNQALFISICIFWTICTTEYTQFTFETQRKQLQYYLIALVPTVAFSAYAIIKSRINGVMGGSMEQLTCSEQVVLYIQHKITKLDQTLQKMGIKQFHLNDCINKNCFCNKQEQYQMFQTEYILFLFKQGFMKFTKIHDQYPLHQSYIKYLVEHEMFPTAVEEQLRFKNRVVRFSLYQYCYSKRINSFLEDYFVNLKDKYFNKSVYTDFLQYQNDLQVLRGQLLDLTELKMNFWNQINCNYAKVVNIQRVGFQYLKDINKMHQFYMKRIHNIQQEAKVFSGSLVYNLFLLTATNYKDVAQNNIKEIKKSFDLLFQQQLKLSHRLYIVKVSGMEDKLGWIENASKSFKNIVQFPGTRAQIINRFISEFIPPVYIAEHERGIKNMKKVSIGKFIGRNIQSLFLFTKKQRIYPCQMVLKYSTDIINELSIIAVIKRNKQNSESVIVDINGNFLYSQKNPQKYQKIVANPQVQAAIRTFSEKWKDTCSGSPIYPLSEPVKTQLTFNESPMSISINSPLSESFRYPNYPPIHLSIVDQMSVNYCIEGSVLQ